MTRDDLNKNYDIIYDHRNLIIQLKQMKIDIHGSRNDTTIYNTFYYYDEAGNRIRKMTYDTEDDSLKSDFVYSRDVSGKEMAIYENGSIKQWNIWGMDNAGFITGEGDKRYYLKDHLGSVRAVIDDGGSLVSAQDYDAWGYQLQDRSYNSEESVYKFTSKERDEENKYDYFGARYYDARITNWTSVDPLMEKHYDYSPYNYVLRNPLKLIDPDGAQVNIIQDFQNAYNWYTNARIERDYYNSLSMVQKFQLSIEYKNKIVNTGRVEATGDEMLLAAPFEIAIGATLKSLLGTSTLYRMVQSVELKNIQILKKYSLIEGVESKYFWTSTKDANWFMESMKKMEGMENEVFTLTKVKVRNRLLKRPDVYNEFDLSHEMYIVGEKTLKKFSKPIIPEF